MSDHPLALNEVLIFVELLVIHGLQLSPFLIFHSEPVNQLISKHLCPQSVSEHLLLFLPIFTLVLLLDTSVHFTLLWLSVVTLKSWLTTLLSVVLKLALSVLDLMHKESAKVLLILSLNLL